MQIQFLTVIMADSRISAFGWPNHKSKCELLQLRGMPLALRGCKFESRLTKNVECNKCFRYWQGQDFIVKLQPLFSTHEKMVTAAAKSKDA